MNAIYAAVWMAALLKWGDWRHWQKYYPTLLFLIIGDLLYEYLLADFYPMWTYSSNGIDNTIGLTHTHIFLSIMLIKYPATVLVYLSKFPEGSWTKKIFYIIGWVLLYALNEAIDRKMNLIEYDHGWNFWWSCLFNLVMFTILSIHHFNPIPAWLLSFAFIVFLWTTFNVPITLLR